MWLIVKTDFYKEQLAVEEFSQLPLVRNTYFPVYRKQLPELEGKQKRYRFCATIAGILFINIKEEDVSRLMHHHLTASGYFHVDGERFISNAHLLNFFTEPKPLGVVMAMARMTNEDIHRFRIYNQKLAERVEELQILDVDYHQLEQEHDTVCLTEGPYQGFLGVVKQVKTKGVKDRNLFFRVGNWSMRLSGVRRFDYVVIREATKGGRAQIVNSYRYIDQLLGQLQATYFTDNAGQSLRTLLTLLNHGKNLKSCKEQLMQLASSDARPDQRRQYALLGTFLEQADTDTQAALLSLSTYYQSIDNTLQKGLESNILDVQLRPFLTPTPGITLPRGSRFALLAHRDFTEVILRLNLKPLFVSEKIYKPLTIVYQRQGVYKKGKKAGEPMEPKIVKLSDKDYIYYAHLAIVGG